MGLKNKRSVFEHDFDDVSEHFPKLKYVWNTEAKMWVITGELDICDTMGVYWNTFDVAILVPRGYPFCVPILLEKSTIIPREKDWHISSEGICCLDVDQNLSVMAKTGIHLTDFITSKIYTYLANQLYKLAEKKYAGEEYGHGTDGIIQYYKEDLRMPSIEAAIKVIDYILNKPGIGRNDPCPCGSGNKLKKCHLAELNILQTLGNEKISSDRKQMTACLSGIN